MRNDDRERHTRREFLVISAAFLFATTGEAGAQETPRRPTPACGNGITPAQTAGPFFKPNSPQRVSLLEPGMAGTRLVVEGRVLSTECTPIPRALVDVWQADDQGRYDNSGQRLRGHQFTDDAGRYRLETIVPGLYPGRTRHLHVRVQAPTQPVLTTQLYLPGEAENQRDGIFHPDLVMKVREADGGRLGAFDFVLDGRGGRGR
jgi:protocatechuate 3,4-dioxygenase beta subunit